MFEKSKVQRCRMTKRINNGKWKRWWEFRKLHFVISKCRKYTRALYFCFVFYLRRFQVTIKLVHIFGSTCWISVCSLHGPIFRLKLNKSQIIKCLKGGYTLTAVTFKLVVWRNLFFNTLRYRLPQSTIYWRIFSLLIYLSVAGLTVKRELSASKNRALES